MGVTLKSFTTKVIYVMGKVLSGELSCIQTGLVRTIPVIVLGVPIFRISCCSLFSESVREPLRAPYYSYPGLNSLYSDGGGMSTYTRSHDVRNRNFDVATKTFDSPR